MTRSSKVRRIVEQSSLSADAEVRYLVESTDVSPFQARELIREHRRDREKLLEIARRTKAES